MVELSILCVTRGEAQAEPFIKAMGALALKTNAQFVLAMDSTGPGTLACPGSTRPMSVCSKGYVESVLDEALAKCQGTYVLRLDDDEKASPSMVKWLVAREYLAADHWKFPRYNLWGDAQHYIANPPLWPDHQTRLSVKAKAGGRTTVHAGSPHGGGELAPCAIEHHKFLLKSREERMRIAEVYDKFSPGYGTGGMKPFSLPEDAFDLLALEHV